MSSILTRTALRLIFPLTLLYAAYLALKGHNEPGGGFVGGLMVSVALLLYRMANGRGALIRLLPFHPRVLVSVGLGIAAATAFVPLLFGRPVMTSLVIDALPIGFGQTIHFASAVFFDAGVLLVVVGVSVGMIQRLNDEIDVRELHRAARQAEHDGVTPGGEA
ncbi:MAG: MnhB domain-containing protein [Planctomycetota bacterium]